MARASRVFPIRVQPFLMRRHNPRKAALLKLFFYINRIKVKRQLMGLSSRHFQTDLRPFPAPLRSLPGEIINSLVEEDSATGRQVSRHALSRSEA